MGPQKPNGLVTFTKLRSVSRDVGAVSSEPATHPTSEIMLGTTKLIASDSSTFSTRTKIAESMPNSVPRAKP